MAIAPMHLLPGASNALSAYGSKDHSSSNALAAAQEQQADATAENAELASASQKMSEAASQFTSRRRLEIKENTGSSAFEAVLEEDVYPKVMALLEVAAIRQTTLETLMQQARALFPDDSDLVMVLRELLRRRQLNPMQSRQLTQLLKHTQAQANPRDVKAGINCSLKARLFGMKHMALKPPLLRGSYRRFLQNDQPEIEDYQDWISCYGHECRALVLDFIEAALLTDIDAQDPSCSALEFGPLLSKLGQLKRLRSADIIFIQLLLSHRTTAGLNNGEADWLVLFFSLLLMPAEVHRHLHDLLADVFLLVSQKERSTVLHIIYKAIKSIPVELFPDAEAASALLADIEILAGRIYQRELAENKRRQ